MLFDFFVLIIFLYRENPLRNSFFLYDELRTSFRAVFVDRNTNNMDFSTCAAASLLAWSRHNCLFFLILPNES